MKPKIIGIFICMLMISSIIPLGISVGAISKTIYVDDDAAPGGDGSYEHPFQFIEDGIEYADPYDTVYVFNGIYRGKTTTPILIEKPLHLEGESMDNTIIDVRNYQAKKGIRLTTYASGSTIEKFTITCGYKTGFVGQGKYGIITLNGPDLYDLSFRNLNINTMFDGIELYDIPCSSVTIENCDLSTIVNNGITFDYVSNLNINNCYFSKNKNNGIVINGGNDITISNCEFTKCGKKAGDNAIKLTGNGNDRFLTNVSVHDCYVHHGGGAVTLRFLTGNQENRNTIYNNEIHDNDPSGINVGYVEYTDIYNNELYNNEKNGIYGPSSEIEPESMQNTIKNNIIYDNGPISNDVNLDGGILLNGFIDTVVEGNTIYSNTNGIFVWNCEHTTIRDNFMQNRYNGIWSEDNLALTITENIITEGWGYGIIIRDTPPNPGLNTYIYENTIANMYGIGFYCSESASDNIIYHNNFINLWDYAADLDENVDNLWYNQALEEGNYWDDLIDNPGYPYYYVIPIQGSPSFPNRDYYPLSYPKNLPDISYGPNRPKKPIGLDEVIRGLPYYYDSYAVDLNGDQVYLQFFWGDGERTDWLGPYDSGQYVTASHTWVTAGVYEITVKAKDEHDNMGIPFSWPKIITVI